MGTSVFTKVLNGEIPGTVLYQDELCAAIRDINPQAPNHFLIFPKQEVRALSEVTDQALLGRLLFVANLLAQQNRFLETGYRVVINNGRHGGQTVDHLHVHVLGGRQMTWPPG